jgi:hypothetical protein
MGDAQVLAPDFWGDLRRTQDFCSTEAHIPKTKQRESNLHGPMSVCHSLSNAEKIFSA